MRKTLLQILALLPLPLIVLLIYWSGRKPAPPPPLPGAGQVAQGKASGARGRVSLPAAVGKWSLKGKVTIYDKKTLFDRINGAAPAYIRAGFVASYGAEYAHPEVEEPVVVDVYDMSTPAQGLGMYATERDPSYTFTEVGGEGYLASGSLNFWQGRFYVKMAGFGEGEAMDRALVELGRGLAEALPAGKASQEELLAPLALLPAEGRVPHTAGYSHPALGDVSGLERAFYVSITIEGGEDPVRLFVVRPGVPPPAARRLEQLKGYFSGLGAKLSERKEGAITVVRASTEDTSSLALLSGETLLGAVDILEPAQVGAVEKRLLAALKAK